MSLLRASNSGWEAGMGVMSGLGDDRGRFSLVFGGPVTYGLWGWFFFQVVTMMPSDSAQWLLRIHIIELICSASFVSMTTLVFLSLQNPWCFSHSSSLEGAGFSPTSSDVGVVVVVANINLKPRRTPCRATPGQPHPAPLETITDTTIFYHLYDLASESSFLHPEIPLLGP